MGCCHGRPPSSSIDTDVLAPQRFRVIVQFGKGTEFFAIPRFLESCDDWLQSIYPRFPHLEDVCHFLLVSNGINIRRWDLIYFLGASLSPFQGNSGIPVLKLYSSKAPPALVREVSSSQRPRCPPIHLCLRLEKSGLLPRFTLPEARFSRRVCELADVLVPKDARVEQHPSKEPSWKQLRLRIQIHQDEWQIRKDDGFREEVEKKCGLSRLKQFWFIENPALVDWKSTFDNIFDCVEEHWRNVRKQEKSRRRGETNVDESRVIFSFDDNVSVGQKEALRKNMLSGILKLPVEIRQDTQRKTEETFECFTFSLTGRNSVDEPYADDRPKCSLSREEFRETDDIKIEFQFDPDEVKVMTGRIYLGCLLLSKLFVRSESEIDDQNLPFIDPMVLEYYCQQLGNERYADQIRAFFLPYAGQTDRGKRGIVFYGPPGTGKSYAVVQLVEQLGLVMTNVDCHLDSGRFRGSLVGQTEKNIRAEARTCCNMEGLSRTKNRRTKLPPQSVLHCMILDECESLLMNRVSSTTESRSANALNALLPIISNSNKSYGNLVFFACTNFKNQLDPAVLRAGRLDHHIFLGALGIRSVFQILLDPGNDLKQEAEEEGEGKLSWEEFRDLIRHSDLLQNCVCDLTVNFTRAILVEVINVLRRVFSSRPSRPDVLDFAPIYAKVFAEVVNGIVGNQETSDMTFNKLRNDGNLTLQSTFEETKLDWCRIQLSDEFQKTGNLILKHGFERQNRHSLYVDLCHPSDAGQSLPETKICEFTNGQEPGSLVYFVFAPLIRYWRLQQVWFVDCESVHNRRQDLLCRLAEIGEVSRKLDRSMVIIVVDDFIQTRTKGRDSQVVQDEICHGLLRFVINHMATDVWGQTERLCFGLSVQNQALLKFLIRELRVQRRPTSSSRVLHQPHYVQCKTFMMIINRLRWLAEFFVEVKQVVLIMEDEENVEDMVISAFKSLVARGFFGEVRMNPGEVTSILPKSPKEKHVLHFDKIVIYYSCSEKPENLVGFLQDFIFRGQLERVGWVQSDCPFVKEKEGFCQQRRRCVRS